MNDASYLKAHRTASRLRKKMRFRAPDRPDQVGMNTNSHAVDGANGRPLSFFMTSGQVSEHSGAAALLKDLPKAQQLLGEHGHDADPFGDALQAKASSPAFRVGDHGTSR